MYSVQYLNITIYLKKVTSGLLSNWGLKTHLSKILLLGNFLFERYKMNKENK